MKRIFLGLMCLAFVAVFAPKVFAAKPTCATIQSGTITDTDGAVITTGYDQYGYNYQANMFNGLYSNNARGEEVEPVPGGDYALMMKWNSAWLSNQDCNGDGKLDRHFGKDSYIGSGAWLTNHASGTYTSETKFHWDVVTTVRDVVVKMNGYGDRTWTYSANFAQNTNELTGSLTDPYVQPSALTGPVLNGVFDGTYVTFSFDYGPTSTQGIRTFQGEINSNGDAIGTWTETGSEHGTGTWLISDFAMKVFNTCEWSDFVKIIAVPTNAQFNNDYWYTDTTFETEIGPSIWGSFAIIQEVSSDPCEEYPYLENVKSELRSGVGNWDF